MPAIEVCPNNRARCVKCGEKIAAGSCRISVRSKSSYSGLRKMVNKYSHSRCYTRGSQPTFYGFHDLPRSMKDDVLSRDPNTIRVRAQEQKLRVQEVKSAKASNGTLKEQNQNGKSTQAATAPKEDAFYFTAVGMKFCTYHVFSSNDNMKLTLKADPENKFDSNAVGVWLDGKRVAFVSRGDNLQLKQKQFLSSQFKVTVNFVNKTYAAATLVARKVAICENTKKRSISTTGEVTQKKKQKASSEVEKNDKTPVASAHEDHSVCKANTTSKKPQTTIDDEFSDVDVDVDSDF